MSPTARARARTCRRRSQPPSSRARAWSRCSSSPVATATALRSRASSSARRRAACATFCASPAMIPKAGDQPETKAVFDIDSATLTRIARDLRDRRAALRAQGHRHAHVFSRRRRCADRSAARLAAGQARSESRSRRAIRADPVLHGCRRSCGATPARLEGAQALRDFFLIIGVAPLRSAKSARWMQQHLYGTIIPDALVRTARARGRSGGGGQRICVELIEELPRMPGSPACT